MKIRLSWIIAVLIVVCLGAEMYHRWRILNPSSASSFAPAQANQATPTDTVNTMFQRMFPGPESDDPKDFIHDRFDYGHLLAGPMSPEEEKFAALFEDRQRSAVIYSALVGDLGHGLRVMDHSETGDTATISATERRAVDDTEDWVTVPFTLELKKKGPNWYVEEAKSAKVPSGVFAAFRERLK